MSNPQSPKEIINQDKIEKSAYSPTGDKILIVHYPDEEKIMTLSTLEDSNGKTEILALKFDSKNSAISYFQNAIEEIQYFQEGTS